MNRSISVVFCLIILLFGSSCAGLVESSVTRFHQLPQTGVTHTYSFLPSKEQKGSLEYATYCAQIANHLTKYGWRLVGGQDLGGDYLVFVSYGIDDGRVITGSIPIIGQTGGGTAYSSGTVRTNYGTTANYSGTTTTPATFGTVGSMPYNHKEFDRQLMITIIDREKSQGNEIVKVYEGRVLSSGSVGEISAVLPTMIEALFQKFPGVSGKHENVNLALKQ